MTVPHKFYKFSDKAAIGQAIYDSLVHGLAFTLKERSQYVILVSGGSFPSILANATPKAGLDWSKMHVLFADERIVPITHTESNAKAFNDAGIWDKILPGANVHTIDGSKSPEECAQDYWNRCVLKLYPNASHANPPAFDTVFLGMGEDGHTASLFPGHALLKSSQAIDSLNDSPKSPSKRITFTLPTLNKAEHTIFVATGAGKVDAIRAALEAKVPAGMIKNAHRSVQWFVDSDAANAVPNDLMFEFSLHK